LQFTAQEKAQIVTNGHKISCGCRQNLGQLTLWPQKEAIVVVPRIPPKDVAKNLGVSIPTLYRWIPAAAQV
jgi:hypothetical protein